MPGSEDLKSDRIFWCAFLVLDGVLYTADMKTLVQYPAGKPDAVFEIPDGVTTVNDYSMFDALNLERLTIPASVTNWNGGHILGWTCTKLTCVVVDSPSVAAKLSSRSTEAGLVLRYAKTVYVSENAASALPEKFFDMFSETASDMDGYRKYESI